MEMTQTDILAWLIAGSIASWLAYEMWGRGPLGMAADWLAGLVGALIGVFLPPLLLWLVSLILAVTRREAVEALNWSQRVEGLHWWVSGPLALVGALLLIRLFRVIFGVRSSP